MSLVGYIPLEKRRFWVNIGGVPIVNDLNLSISTGVVNL